MFNKSRQWHYRCDHYQKALPMSENKQTQQGSGSAENKGGSREDQKNPLTNPGGKEKQDIARDINESSNRVGSLRNTGQLSGRDDYAGGSGDDMSAENTNEPTDR